MYMYMTDRLVFNANFSNISAIFLCELMRIYLLATVRYNVAIHNLPNNVKVE